MIPAECVPGTLVFHKNKIYGKVIDPGYVQVGPGYLHTSVQHYVRVSVSNGHGGLILDWPLERCIVVDKHKDGNYEI